MEVDISLHSLHEVIPDGEWASQWSIHVPVEKNPSPVLMQYNPTN